MAEGKIKMKKIFIMVAAVCTMLVCASCGNTSNDNENNVNLTNSEAVAENDNVNNDDGTSAVLPDKSHFETVPDDANASFNYVIETSRSLYKNGNGKRLYGYLGTEKVNNKNCYVFSIYEENDNKHNEIATVAIEPKTFTMYELGKNGKFVKIAVKEVSSDDSECEWADKVTESFSKYLSSNSVKVANVSEKKTTK